MAFGAILGQRPGVQSVNNVLPDVQGNVVLNAENVGAAPAGYGLGATGQGTKITTASDVDGIQKNGWYALWADSNVDIGGYINSFFNLFVLMYNDKYGVQTIYMPNGESLIRAMNNNIWNPWEWVNPPMTAGVEYRTTERYNNLPVYTTIIDGGAIPSANSQKFVKHNKAVKQIVRYAISTNAYGTAVPGFSFSGSTPQDVSIYGGANQNGVFLAVKSLNWTQFNWWVQIWYTK